MKTSMFHVPTLTADESNEFMRRLRAFEEPDGMEEELDQHRKAIRDDPDE